MNKLYSKNCVVCKTSRIQPNFPYKKTKNNWGLIITFHFEQWGCVSLTVCPQCRQKASFEKMYETTKTIIQEKHLLQKIPWEKI